MNFGGRAFAGRTLVDATPAYIKDVPVTSAPYAEISKIGGMSYKSKNLLKVDGVDFSQQINVANLHGKKINAMFKENTQYTFSWIATWINGSTTSQLLYLQIDYTDGTSTNWTNCVATPSNNKSRMGRTTEAGKTVKSMSFIYSAEAVFLFEEAQLVEGTERMSSYEPYFSGLRDGKVTRVKSVGKNIFSSAVEWAWQSDITKEADGKVIMTRNANGGVSYVQTKQIYLQGGKTYTIRHAGSNIEFGYILRGGTETVLNASYGKLTFTPATSGYYFMRFYMLNSKTAIGDVAYIYWWINEGNVDLPYSPYIEHTLEIPEALISKEWYGMGVPNTEGYNSVDFTNGKAYIKAKKYVFTGDELWMMENAPKPYFYLTVGEYGDVIANAIICNRYEQNTIGTSNESIGINVINSNGYKDARIVVRPEGDLTSVAAWKNKLLELKMSNNHLTAIIGFTKFQTEDISDIITSDNLIGVEGGGTLTFENEYGYDVPSDVVFHLNSNKELSADKFVGDLVGTAVRAIRDGDGSVIPDKYASKEYVADKYASKEYVADKYASKEYVAEAIGIAAQDIIDSTY